MRHRNGNAPGYARGGPDLLGVLFDAVMADFYLTLVEQHVVRLSGATEDLNKGMRMLEPAAHRAGVLADDGHALPRVEGRVEKARQNLSCLRAKRMVSAAADFELGRLPCQPHDREGSVFLSRWRKGDDQSGFERGKWKSRAATDMGKRGGGREPAP